MTAISRCRSLSMISQFIMLNVVPCLCINLLFYQVILEDSWVSLLAVHFWRSLSCWNAYSWVQCTITNVYGGADSRKWKSTILTHLMIQLKGTITIQTRMAATTVTIITQLTVTVTTLPTAFHRHRYKKSPILSEWNVLSLLYFLNFSATCMSVIITGFLLFFTQTWRVKQLKYQIYIIYIFMKKANQQYVIMTKIS